MANMDVADRLLATLRLRIPAATKAGINLELYNTMDEFFTDTNAWRWESSVALQTDVTNYPIFPPAGTDLVRVMGLTHKGTALAPLQEDTEITVRQQGRIVGTPFPDGDAQFEPNEIVQAGGIFRYSLFFPKYITIDVPPSEEATQAPIKVLLALKLNMQCLEDEPNEWPVEEWMWSTFHEAFLDGTLGRMFSATSKPYSNPQLAQYHMKRFRKFIGRGRQEAQRGYIFNQQRFRFPKWA